MEVKNSIIFIVVGLAVAGPAWYFGIHTTQQAMKSADETVNGTVVSTDIRTVSGDKHDRYDYQPDIDYRYKYNGEPYTNDNLRPGSVATNLESKSEAQDFINKYPEGREVTVYLNPENPSQSFLEKKGPDRMMYGIVVFSLLFLLNGVWGLVSSVFGKE